LEQWALAHPHMEQRKGQDKRRRKKMIFGYPQQTAIERLAGTG